MSETRLHGVASMHDQHGSPMRALEAIVDQYGLTFVVTTLAVICNEKADHILQNWQDSNAARNWHLDSKTLDKAARNVMSDG